MQGRVLDVGRVRGDIYLNFGQDWREDFTIKLRARAEQNLLGMSGDELSGKMVEVRGWVHWSGGPMIDLETPGQITLVQEKDGPSSKERAVSSRFGGLNGVCG